MAKLGHGKICHVALPAADVETSARFYEQVFAWAIRRQGSRITFDDGVAEVSGHFVAGGTPREPAPLIYLWVDDLHEAVGRVEAAGGSVERPEGVDPGERTVWFRDPAGNVMGLYQEP